MSSNSERFLDDIYKQLAWRIKEASTLYTAVRSSSADAQFTNMRSGVALLYAHWEGGVKQIACNYVDFVSRERVPYAQLAHNLLAVKLASLLGEPTRKASYYHKAVDLLLRRAHECAQLPSSIISTESNLTYEVFSEILFALGIETTHFALRKNFIDQNLVNKRNRIAHGERFQMTVSEYEEIHNGVVGLIRDFQRELVALVTSESWRSAA